MIGWLLALLLEHRLPFGKGIERQTGRRLSRAKRRNLRFIGGDPMSDAFRAYPEPGARDLALLALTDIGAGTFVSPDQHTPAARGVRVVATIANKSGTIAVVVTIQGKDLASGAYYDILSSASLTADGVTQLVVYPGVAAAANAAVSAPMPPTWRVQVVSGTGTTPELDLTVGAAAIP